jgi:hypothetical protein
MLTHRQVQRKVRSITALATDDVSKAFTAGMSIEVSNDVAIEATNPGPVNSC